MLRIWIYPWNDFESHFYISFFLNDLLPCASLFIFHEISCNCFLCILSRFQISISYQSSKVYLNNIWGWCMFACIHILSRRGWSWNFHVIWLQPIYHYHKCNGEWKQRMFALFDFNEIEDFVSQITKYGVGIKF